MSPWPADSRPRIHSTSPASSTSAPRFPAEEPGPSRRVSRPRGIERAAAATCRCIRTPRRAPRRRASSCRCSGPEPSASGRRRAHATSRQVIDLGGDVHDRRKRGAFLPTRGGDDHNRRDREDTEGTEATEIHHTEETGGTEKRINTEATGESEKNDSYS